MADFKRNVKYDLAFANCVYSGISREIDFYMSSIDTYGDRTEELQYICDRYANEIMVSGKYLYEKLEEYKKAVKEAVA